MSFTNLTPDVNPDGSRFASGMTTFGVRFFYFTFVPSSPTCSFFLERNIYRNEESITRIFTFNSPTSLLTQTNVSNVRLPCTFTNGLIGLFTPFGSTYRNQTVTPDFIMNNLVVGNLYILESRTIYNDPGMDFGANIKNVNGINLPLTYIQSSLSPIMPNNPLPIPIPNPIGLPDIPSRLIATSINRGVSLTWNLTAQASSYVIYKEGLLFSTTSTNNYEDYQVISGNPYSYTVSAVNSIGEGAQSMPVRITPIFLFTCGVPNRTPLGAVIENSNIRFNYFLFTPLSSSLDVYLANSQNATSKAIIGIYDTTDSSNTNLLTTSNVSSLDGNVIFTSNIVGGFTFNGINVITAGDYLNNGLTPNFRLSLPVGDMSTSSAMVKTYVLEIVAYKSSAVPFSSDFGVSFKNVGYPMGMTQLTYNSVNFTRTIPKPYVVEFDFSRITLANYTQYIYPYITIFQNVKNVIESMISSSPNARGFNRNNDMLVKFIIDDLPGDTLGESSLDRWTNDASRSPDITFEQSITFNARYFINGYITSPANFNGAPTVNNKPNITFFNILLHEIIHGLGIFYNDSFNSSSSNVGWNPLLTNVADNTPYYKGPIGSAALSSYQTYCKSNQLQRIPVEANYGAGTALSHWAEGDAPKMPNDYRYFNGIYTPALKYEIMTGFINKNEFLTGLTSGALKDYGYNVNLICPYIVAHPYVNLMPMISSETDSFKIKCMAISNNSKVTHRLIIEKMPLPQQPQQPQQPQEPLPLPPQQPPVNSFQNIRPIVFYRGIYYS